MPTPFLMTCFTVLPLLCFPVKRSFAKGIFHREVLEMQYSKRLEVYYTSLRRIGFLDQMLLCVGDKSRVLPPVGLSLHLLSLVRVGEMSGEINL